MASISVEHQGVYEGAQEGHATKIYVMRIDPDGSSAWETLLTDVAIPREDRGARQTGRAESVGREFGR